jgi:hypothetical protein
MRARRLSSAAGGALLALLGMLLWPSGVGATPTLMLSASHGQASAVFTATATFDPDVPGGNCFEDSAVFYWDQTAFGCAGINRRGEGDGRALHRRASDPRWPRVMRRLP